MQVNIGERGEEGREETRLEREGDKAQRERERAEIESGERQQREPERGEMYTVRKKLAYVERMRREKKEEQKIHRYRQMKQGEDEKSLSQC